MYKYHCLNPISPVGLAKLTSEYEKTENFDDADLCLVRSAVMHDMDLPSKLLAVGRAGAGVNNIPLDKCAEAGVVVFNTPGANANAVKELVLAGMLLASRDIIGGVQWCADNKDLADIAKQSEKEKKNFAGTEIKGKKLGIIGLGAIGVLVANSAIHLGMEVYGYDPYLSVNAAWELSHNAHHVTDVNEIYRECDFITIHVPLLDSTKGMISKEAIDLMKPSTVILNFARDLLVDEDAVVEALSAGKIRKYVTDFANPTTAGKKGVILTPHLGASTEEAEDNCAVMAAQELMDYAENGNITHAVNYPDLNMGICTRKARVAVMHKNVKGVIAKFTTILGDADINVAGMSNSSKGDFAYALLDVDSEVPEAVVSKLKAIDDVIRVRVL